MCAAEDCVADVVGLVVRRTAKPELPHWNIHSVEVSQTVAEHRGSDAFRTETAALLRS